MGNETLKNLSLEITPDFLLALSRVGLGLLEHSLDLSSSGDVLWWVTLCYFSNWIRCELFAKGAFGFGRWDVNLRVIGQIKARCVFEFSCVVHEMYRKLLVGRLFDPNVCLGSLFPLQKLVGCYFCTIQRYCSALVCLTKFQNIVIHNCADSCSGSLWNSFMDLFRGSSREQAFCTDRPP